MWEFHFFAPVGTAPSGEFENFAARNMNEPLRPGGSTLLECSSAVATLPRINLLSFGACDRIADTGVRHTEHSVCVRGLDRLDTAVDYEPSRTRNTQTVMHNRFTTISHLHMS